MHTESRQPESAQPPAQSVGTLLSVNVGMPKNVQWRGKTVFTGVFKDPVTGPRRASKLNVEGDGQGDLAGHGGEQRAVFVYQIESYRYWESQLGRKDFVYGQFGENFTVEGLGDDEVCVGDRYRIGTAVFEVTQPRVTCYRVGIRMNDPQIPALLHLARVWEQAVWLWRRRPRWCRRGAMPVLCVVRARGVQQSEHGVLVVSIERLLPSLRGAARPSDQDR